MCCCHLCSVILTLNNICFFQADWETKTHFRNLLLLVGHINTSSWQPLSVSIAVICAGARRLFFCSGHGWCSWPGLRCQWGEVLIKVKLTLVQESAAVPGLVSPARGMGHLGALHLSRASRNGLQLLSLKIKACDILQKSFLISWGGEVAVGLVMALWLW